MGKREEKLVKAFLYSPIDTDVKMPCHCGEELKITSYGCGNGNGNGIASCSNNHHMILAHQFVSKESLPRYSDSFDFNFKITRFEDEICFYCKTRIGDTDWQRELANGAVHRECHYDNLIKVIADARKQKMSWVEIEDLLAKKQLSWETELGTMKFYKWLIIRKMDMMEKKNE